jgi:uncharacterized repeat protein (TIGR01451 family)
MIGNHARRTGALALRIAVAWPLVILPGQTQSAFAEIINQAIVSGSAPNGTPVTSGPAIANAITATAAPAMLVTKRATLNDDDGKAGLTAGDTITYEIAAENSGNVAIAGLSLTDTMTRNGVTIAAGPVATAPVGDAQVMGLLEPRETWLFQYNYTLTQADLDAGSIITNRMDAEGTSNGGTLSGSASVDVAIDPVAAMTVTKTATSSFARAGDAVTWDVVVTNSGAVTLTSVDLTDPIADTIICPATGNANVDNLAPLATETCVATRTATEDDVADGVINNTVTAEATPATGDPFTRTAEATVTGEGANLETVKALAAGSVTPSAGQVVGYTITITNRGPADATDVTLTDQLPTGLTPTPNNGSVTLGTWDPATGLWTIPTLTAGSDAILILEGTVPPGLTPSPVTNTVEPASSAENDPTSDGDVLTITIVPVVLPIVADDDVVATPVDSTKAQAAVLNVLGNDTLGGTAATAGTAPGTVIVTPIGTLPDGLTLNPDGTVDVAQFTDPGSYSFEYTICEVANPLNCDTATVTITIERKIPRLSGTVFLDRNSNGQFDGPDTVLPNYRAELVDAAGKVIASADTDASGYYSLEGFPPGTYSIRFLDPVTGVYVGQIRDIVVAMDDVIVDQNIPVDPEGVVYDSVTGKPITGARVTLTDASGTALPDACLLPNQQNQTTRSDGQYRFDIVAGANAACPVGDTVYRLTIVPPAGYLDPTSTNIPPQPGPLDADTCPLDAAPGGSCALTLSETPHPVTSPSPYFMSFSIGLGDPHVVNNHVPLDPILAIDTSKLSLAKTADRLVAKRGDPVRYTLLARNTGDRSIDGITLVDVLPSGFVFIDGSATLDGTASTPAINGLQFTFRPLTIAARGELRITFLVRIGANVGVGEHINRARLRDAAGGPITPEATATVRVEAEHVFDCGDVIGKVFDDKNRNGYQDEGEPGLAGVRVATVRGTLITTDAFGRFNVPCAELPDRDIGSNFILKLDARTLPTGYRLTTENPRVVRLTAGKLTELNFGAAITRVVRIDLDARAFVRDAADPVPALQRGIDALLRTLGSEPSVLRMTYHKGNEPDSLVTRRLSGLSKTIRLEWARSGRDYDLEIETIVQTDQ